MMAPAFRPYDTRIMPDPPRTIARPFLPGYVANVVYSCAAPAVGRDVLLPHAVADGYAASTATTVDALLGAMA